MLILSSKEITTLEYLPDEILLNICKYLRGADILYSFYNLNSRLNCTISDYLNHVNLMSVSHRQFEYSVSEVLPKIGYGVRTFILNGNWETIISKRLFAILFESPFSDLFPSLEKLVLKWFSSERLTPFINHIEDCQHLTELDIRYLRGAGDSTLLQKILSANNNRLKIVRFDQDSSDLDIESSKNQIVCHNIEHLTVNLKNSEHIIDVFQLVPNVISLSLNIDELSESLVSKKSLKNLPLLEKLTDFQIRSINLFWNRQEISEILKSIPSLKRLTLDFRTEDERLINELDLIGILPRSLVKLDYFIRFYVSKMDGDRTDFKSNSISYPISILPDCPRCRYIVHTIPCNIRSLILPANIAEKLLKGWEYLNSVEDLCIYDANSFTDILSMLEHFRRIKSLTIDTHERATPLEIQQELKTNQVKLPRLKQIDISGITPLAPLLEAAPNLDYLIVSFACLEALMLDQRTTSILSKRITRLNVSDWTKIDSNLLNTIVQIFSSLRHLVITLKDPNVIINSFVLSILSLVEGRKKLSFDVKGSVSNDVKDNIRQWILDNTHLTENDSFALECKENWFDLWY